MDEKQSCENQIYSEDYADYILETGGNIEKIRRLFQPDCIQIIDGNFVTIFENQRTQGEISFQKHGYGAVPKCFGLLDTSSIESTGALRVRRRQNFDLNGNGVLVGFVDTGIDYKNPLFQNADGSSRIAYIWDQTLQEGKHPEGIDYGTEFNQAQITEALKNESTTSLLHTDPLYHGTYMAAIAAGNVDENTDFTGIVPNAEIIMVKLKEAKQNLKDFYGIPENVPCYQENDIMMGIRYLWEMAGRLRKPIAICLGVGSNAGSHTGLSPLGTTIDDIGNISGICIVMAAGNETNLGHHFEGTVEGNSERLVEVEIENNALTVELWTNSIGYLAIGITSPGGEFSGRIPIRSFEQRIDFVFEPTSVFIHYERVEYYSGEEVIVLRFQEAVSGIWNIHVYNLEENTAPFHVWLPMRNFISDQTEFLEPSPDTIICNPGNVNRGITIGAYNHRNNSIFINSSRGFTANNMIKPDIVAPGVDVYGPVSALRFGERSGTSVAAAHGAGCAAMLLEWGIVRGNNMGMNSVTAKYYFIKGTRRDNITVPNKSFGWGELDIYNTFDRLRFY